MLTCTDVKRNGIDQMKNTVTDCCSCCSGEVIEWDGMSERVSVSCLTVSSSTSASGLDKVSRRPALTRSVDQTGMMNKHAISVCHSCLILFCFFSLLLRPDVIPADG